ncbi:MAG: glycosyltransferase family 39 protein [Roseibium sp.]|nr:glycosyltransferase family 39 protein [Roseibium sp.]
MTETAETSGNAGNGPAPDGATNGNPSERRPFWLRLFGHDASAPVFLLLLSLVIFFPGQWTVPPLDRDEPRFAQATKQMLETGDYVDIRFQDQARHKKPVGIYWLQVAAAKVVGSGAESPLWVYRLPSAIGATLAVLASFWMARAFMGPAGALMVGIFVASAIILNVEARLAKTDAMLFFTIVLAQGALARIWLAEDGRRRWGLGFVFWTALAAGILIKGPVAPMVVGTTVVALMVLRRRLAWFNGASPVLGLLWMLALVSPWFVAIGLATDGAFFNEAIGRDLLGKVAEGQESHGAPPLTHLAAMLGVFWPLPAFFLICLPTIWQQRKSPLVTFAAAWFFPSWIVFELVATKLPHYTMPLLPALVLPLAAALMDGAGTAAAKWLRWTAAILLAVPVVAIAVAAFAGPFVFGIWPSPPGVVLAALAAALAVMAGRQLLRAQPLKALPRAVGASVLMMIAIWGFAGPALSPIWVSPRLAAAIDAVPNCPNPAVVTSGFHEPSFIFLQGTDTRIANAPDAAAFLADGDPSTCRIAAIESREKAAFLDAAQAISLVPVISGTVEGLNINGGDDVDIGLYRAPGPAAQ